MYKANKNGKRKLIVILSHKIVIDFANFFTIFTFTLTDYWHDRRAYVNGSFRSGSFRTWSFRPNVLSISFGGSFPPIISSHELSCSQGVLMVYPCSSVARPPFSNIFSQPLGQLKPDFIWNLLRKMEQSIYKWSWSHYLDGRHAHI